MHKKIPELRSNTFKVYILTEPHISSRFIVFIQFFIEYKPSHEARQPNSTHGKIYGNYSPRLSISASLSTIVCLWRPWCAHYAAWSCAVSCVICHHYFINCTMYRQCFMCYYCVTDPTNKSMISSPNVRINPIEDEIPISPKETLGVRLQFYGLSFFGVFLWSNTLEWVPRDHAPMAPC